MAISVRDIQEKEFATQAKGGYNVEEVDDFLDEIAEQLAALVRENLALNQQITGLEADVEAAKKAAAEAEARTPEYNEKGYFDNLQKSMREAMIGAQRIADETVAEAKSQADRMKADAQMEADATVGKAQRDAEKITADAQNRLTELKEQFETMKTSAASFKANFSRMLEENTAMLKDKMNLF
ncbi:MAG: DivIVA domain-containing protein [Clostridia bacterium]|nr:DivIVA domain-containing protein [Clostridia bacterium]